MSELEATRQRIREMLSGPGKTTRFIRDNLDFPHDYCCLIFPFAWNEGAYPRWGGKMLTVHRIMCEYRNGPPPSDKHHSAHSCNRGKEGCINPMHVSWKTPAENQLDRKHAGGPQRKLTAQQAAEIRELKGLEPQAATAKRFGVSIRNVNMIQNGLTWRQDRTHCRVFTDDEVRAIRAFQGTNKDCAKLYGAKPGQISNIKNRLFYKHVPDASALTSATSPGER